MARTYAALKDRIDELTNSLLSFTRRADGDYTQSEIDRTKSFVLLAHAEIESFIEEIALEASSEAFERWNRSNTHSYILSRLISHFYAASNAEYNYLNSEAIEKSKNSYAHTLGTNHGVKEKNILAIFIPLGFEFSDFDPTILLSFSTFGEDRGIFAHKTHKARQAVNPNDEEKRVKETLLPEISKIYQCLQNLRIKTK